jgi:hypothetical protein
VSANQLLPSSSGLHYLFGVFDFGIVFISTGISALPSNAVQSELSIESINCLPFLESLSEEKRFLGSLFFSYSIFVLSAISLAQGTPLYLM